MSKFVTIFRDQVNAQECDIMGHFNIQFYAAKVAGGLSASMGKIGLPDSAGISVQHKAAFSHYQGELHVDDELEVRAAILAVGDDHIRLLAEIINSGTGKLSSSFDLHCQACDTDSRRPTTWPDRIRDELATRIIDLPVQKRIPTAGTHVPASVGSSANAFVSSRGTIDAWDCDERGAMCLRQYYAIASDGIGPLRHRMGITRDLAKTKHWGGAGLEYFVRFLAPIDAGDIYTLRTGLLQVAEKTFRVGHRLFNDSSGDLTATFDIVACMFDLQARRTMKIPDEIRTQAEMMLIDWGVPA